MGIVKHIAKTGGYDSNPFNFAHVNLNSIELLADGLPIGKKYQPNFTTGDFARTYYSIATGLSKGSADWSNGITPTSFAAGQALYVFNNTGDLCDGGVHLINNGTLTLNLSFSVPLADNVSVFVQQEKDDIIEIDAEQRVTVLAGVL